MEWKNSRNVFLIVLAGVVVTFFIYLGMNYFSTTEEKFSVDSIFIKSSIKPGGNYSGVVRITNERDSFEMFNVSLSGVEGISSPLNQGFELAPNETKAIGITFSNISESQRGIYVGSLEIVSGGEERSVPIILEVESEELLFDANLNLYPSGSVEPGEQMRAEIRVYDLTFLGSSSVELEYFVKDFQGNVVFFESDNLVVSDNLGSKMKSFTLPEDLQEGDYLFGVSVRYENSTGTSSSFFVVEEESFFEGAFDDSFLLIVIGFIFVIFILLIAVFYSVYSKDRFLNELQNQYKSELRRQSDYLREREEKIDRKLKGVGEKKISRRLFEEAKKRVERDIRKEHKSRVKKAKGLKKRNKKNELKNQIDEWKKKGYDTSVLEKNVPTEKDIRKKINEWKKKGYDTSVLSK